MHFLSTVRVVDGCLRLWGVAAALGLLLCFKGKGPKARDQLDTPPLTLASVQRCHFETSWQLSVNQQVGLIVDFFIKANATSFVIYINYCLFEFFSSKILHFIRFLLHLQLHRRGSQPRSFYNSVMLLPPSDLKDQRWNPGPIEVHGKIPTYYSGTRIAPQHIRG